MKIIGETDCPHCKKTHEAELDIDNLDLKQPEKPQVRVKEVRSQQPQAQMLVEKQEEPEPIIKTKTKIPSHIPKFKCKNCDKLHDNPDYSKRPKFKCNNCGALNPEPKCQYCTKYDEFEELSEDELDELGIPEAEHEHKHEDDE